MYKKNNTFFNGQKNCELLHMFHTGLGFDRLWLVYWVGLNADCVLVHMETRYLMTWTNDARVAHRRVGGVNRPRCFFAPRSV